MKPKFYTLLFFTTLLSSCYNSILDDSKTTDLINISFIQLNFVTWDNFEDGYIPVFGDEILTTTILSFEKNVKLNDDEINTLQSKSTLMYKVPSTVYGYYTFEGFYFDKDKTNNLNKLTSELPITDYSTYYYGLAG